MTVKELKIKLSEYDDNYLVKISSWNFDSYDPISKYQDVDTIEYDDEYIILDTNATE
jgi:hypothetical protein